MNETVKIVLPLPPRNLSPNCPTSSRGGRIGKACAARKCRGLSGDAIRECDIEKTWQVVTMQAIFYHKTERRRDGVNHNAMLKAYQDGIVDGGLVVDDDSEHFTTLPPIFRIDKKTPRVELIIERIK